MFKRLAGLFGGYFVITVPSALRTAIYELLFCSGMDFFGEHTRKDGTLKFCLPRRYMGDFRQSLACGALEEVGISPLRGLPVVLRFLRRRPGITVGIVLFFAWSYVSQRIVWDIRIEANTVTPDHEIVELLTELGCGYGAWFPTIDFDDLHAKSVAQNDSIGWLSVYMNGTVAEVQVRELVRADHDQRESGVYANVVAQEDGIIESVRVVEGQAAVKAGDVVRRGDVVISGVMDRKDPLLPEGGVRFEYAAGEVYAKTVRPISVEITLEREEKVYTGAQKREKNIKIFGNVVKLFQNTGITYEKYDKIKKIERLSLWGMDLPLWVEETVYREYTYETKTVSAEEAVAEGMTELRRLTDEALADGVLAEKIVTSTLSDGIYRIDCLLYVIRDIAETTEFSVPLTEEVP